VYAENIKSESAILLIRSKRPGSVQTAKQVAFVNRFAAFLKHLRRIYPGIVSRGQTGTIIKEAVTFQTALTNQLRYLHGIEQRVLHAVPKIVFKLVNRIIAICNDHEDIERSRIETYLALLEFEGMTTVESKTNAMMFEINEHSWGFLENEKDPRFLVDLLLYWLVTLKVYPPHSGTYS
jgi:hypothetical protein